MACRVIVFIAPGASSHWKMEAALSASGVEVTPAQSAEQVLELIDRFSPLCAVLLCGTTINDEAVRLSEQVHQVDRHCPIVILIPTISTEMALRAMRAGISDVLYENESPTLLADAVRSLIHKTWPLLTSPERCSALICDGRLIGHSAAINRVREQIARISASEANVLITGESGTGKELAAELIHRNSTRKGPLVTVNCAAVPETLVESELFGHERGAFTGATTTRNGKLEYAHGGTLFLDEVGDMSLLAQAKMLRAVESRVVQRLGSNVDIAVHVRLLAATNQDLEQLTREKKFRQDLYYRLNVIRLSLPPLRDRLEDIPDLTEHILCELSSRHNGPLRRIESDVVRRLQMHQWPGNVRELRNILECILVQSSGRSIGYSDIPDHIRQALRSSCSYYGDERSRILSALNSAQWNRSKAAEILSCSRMTLYRKMVKFALPSRRN
jgi:DNA-binding NtrC family response regulator